VAQSSEEIWRTLKLPPHYYFLQWQLLPFSSGHTPLPSGPEQPQSLHSFAAERAGGVLLALPTVNAHTSTINGIVKTFFMIGLCLPLNRF
jgi:hypothetical protein